MHLSDRTIRDDLRREAARVPIPQDMWSNIQQRLDMVEAKAKRKAARREQWKPALAFGFAASVFWLTVIPVGRHLDSVSPERTPQRPAATMPMALKDPTVRYAEPPVKKAPERSQVRPERPIRETYTGLSSF